MGLLSSTVSIMRYKVEGRIEEPVFENVAKGLKKNVINDIDKEAEEKAVGWTTLENPYSPDFANRLFVIDTYLAFCLRIDKKTIPSKIIAKHFAKECAKRLAESGREYLARTEKKLIKDQVIDSLALRIPATPNIYDLLWNNEEGWLWFFSTQKSANEDLETLFQNSFKLRLIRIFPYTMADLLSGLSEGQKNLLNQLTPTHFTE